MNEPAPAVDSVLTELERRARETRKRAALGLGALAVCGLALLGLIFWQVQRELATLRDLQRQRTELEKTIRALAPASRAPDQPPEVRPQPGPADPTPSAVPRRVYIQIASEDQRTKARELSQLLYENNFVAPGTEKVANAPSRNVIKFFREEDRGAAEQVASLLKSQGIEAQIQMLGGFSRVPPGQLEVWFGKGQ